MAWFNCLFGADGASISLERFSIIKKGAVKPLFYNEMIGICFIATA